MLGEEIVITRGRDPVAKLVPTASLPSHHRDTFDRLLVAQAEVEGLTLVSVDPVFDLCDADVMGPSGTEP